mmetsp:Transcript_27761/g.67528  ORF Transcript_27761/g.67528 Transcript_27761/m.67528 type:complete len:586 (-) Transcript_27761:251-2008(-)
MTTASWYQSAPNLEDTIAKAPERTALPRLQGHSRRAYLAACVAGLCLFGMILLSSGQGHIRSGLAVGQVQQRASSRGLASLLPMKSSISARPIDTGGLKQKLNLYLRKRSMAIGASGGYVSNPNYDYDLFVIGAGSGGVRASRISAGHGARVAIADDLAVGLGGTCVNVGCVPKKLFSYGSEITQDVKDSEGFGWNFQDPTLNWERLIENKDKEISRLNGIYERMLTNSGVNVVKGRGKLVDEHTVEVDGNRYTADKILVAVGGWPAMPDIPGKEHLKTSNDIFYTKKVPQKPVILGSGYIAVEFAGILHGYKADAHLVIRREHILKGFDTEMADYLLDSYEKQGIHVHKNTEAVKIEKRGEGDYLVHLKDGSQIESDYVIAAIGRNPKTNGIGLENIGIELDKKGGIVVQKDGQTSVPSVYAIGDCTATLQLTPVALAEGHCFADTQFGHMPRTADLEDVATAVFSHPNLGTVGLSEEAALEKYKTIKVFRSEFRPLKHTVSGSAERSIMKIIVDSATDRVVGMHMVGAHAGEIIQGFAAAIKMRITKKVLDSVIGIHPTSAEEFVTMRTLTYEKSKEAATVAH